MFPAVLLAVLLAGLAWIGWNTTRRADIPFLARHSPAEWILFPVPPDPGAVAVADLATEFRRSFSLASAPGEAALSLRALQQARVVLNGQPVFPGRAGHPKDAARLDVAKLLQPGLNHISVTITNRQGPPALWLWLHGDGLT